MSSEEEDYGVATPFKVTLKAGAGFEAPWLNIEADSAPELVARLVAAQTDDVLDRIVEASRAFRSRFTAAPSASRTATASSGEKAQTPEKSSPPSSSSSGAAVSDTPDKSATRTPESRADSGPGAGTDEDPIVAELNAATTYAELRKVYPKWKNNGWTDDHIKLATARKAALEGDK